jgi:CP family cyanate transporter-like MFS transporter
LSLLWLGGVGLRLTILAVPPVLALIISDLALSGTEVGILNAIPVSLFALVAVPGSLLIARVGAVRALVVGLLIAAAGSALRGFAIGAVTLFAATALMAAGVAVMQPAFPPLVRQWVPRRIGFATAVYTNGLLCGEIFPVVLAAVAVLLLGGGWRGSLELWSIAAAVIALIIFVARPDGEHTSAQHSRWMPDWRDPLLWKVGLVASANNQLYFCTNAFLPGLLLQNGQTELIGPALSALNLGQLPGSILLMLMASRLERRRWPLVVCGALGLLAVVGVATTTSLWAIVASAALVGFTCAVGLTLVLTLPALLVAPDDVPHNSAGMFTIGYGIAMVISIVCGMVWDVTGNAVFAFVPIGLAVVPMLVLPLGIDFKTQRS